MQLSLTSHTPPSRTSIIIMPASVDACAWNSVKSPENESRCAEKNPEHIESRAQTPPSKRGKDLVKVEQFLGCAE